MVISQIRLLIIALSLVLALPAQATTLKILKRFDSTNSVLFLQNDWNPADGNTYWGAIDVLNSTDPVPTDFYGVNVAGSFSVGGDPWETVSIKSHAGEQFDLRGTQEIQLVARPAYVTSRPYASVVLRLTMQDGSIWDQPKVLANNVWQTGAFPVQEGSFARAEWGPQGVFDLGKIASWEIILADLPPGSNHQINFHTLYMKGNYDTPGNAAERFGVDFYSEEGNVLFRHADWNPADGDTDWLYHVRTHPHYYNPLRILKAVYRSEGDPWETVSLRKEAQTHFDLTDSGSGQIVALVNAGLNLDPNALIMSLTMQDGSVWQQGRRLDVVYSTGMTHTFAGVLPYRFPLDPQGKGWTMAAWGPTGNFDLSRIKAWELSFNNLEEGEHSVFLDSIGIMGASLVQADNTFGATGQAEWLELNFASDGVIADIGSEGGVEDSLSISSETPVNVYGFGFNLEVTSSYANPSPDAVVFKLTTSDGKVWQQSYSLPQAGRSVHRIHIFCPPPLSMVRPDPDDLRCKSILGAFYGISSGITKWEVMLNRPPAGEHKIGISLLSTVQ
ncbi:hypothetical protein [Nitrosomonas sp. Nm58]|uniref:hypothetical protein n=1 Tax=Nitrosomonas sp. Nm58 TaxID=200126 RepID=UPI00089541D3|nr:hypothetical protein [Nitrosomonas sp. Nm58]SDZ20875.1 hypothetical protein SAMN05421754_10982 [Nitrosomonas sp. Nm58]